MKLMRQNKESIVNFDNIISLTCMSDNRNNRHKIMATFVSGTTSELACYDTIDKCKQVLACIAKFDDDGKYFQL